MKPFKAVYYYLRRTHLRHWAWIHAKLALGIGWGTAILFVTPESITGSVNADSVGVWALGTMLGAIVSIVGLFMTLSYSKDTRLSGLFTEGVGIVLLAGGPLQYCFVQIGFIIDGEFAQRYALAWFAYSMLAFVLVRILMIAPEMIRQIAINRETKRTEKAEAASVARGDS